MATTSLRLVVQVALPALASGTLGLLCGRYLWPRYVTTDSPAPPPAPPSAPDDLGPALSDIEERLLASESEVRQLRLGVAQVSHDQTDETQEQTPSAERAPATGGPRV